VHAIGGRAIDIAKAIAGAVHVQRRMQGECVGLGAVVVLRGDHLDFAEVLDRLVKGDDAGRLVAVVVGKQYFHGVRRD